MTLPRHVLFVIPPERFRDEELREPRRAVLAAGHRVATVSTRGGTAVGMLGSREAVTTLASVGWDGSDAVVLVGGAGSPDHLWTCEPLLEVVRRYHAAGRPLAAICLSCAVLARAGVLSGRRATVFPARRALLELKRGGAIYVDEPVVRDGMILTASGPEAAPAFGAALVSLLGT